MNQYTVGKRLNQLLNKVESRLQLPRVRSKPVDVDLVLTKACNLACTFCKDYQTDGSQRVSVENFRRAADQLFPTARRINICSGGEPYLHPGLEEILRICRSYGVFTWLLSNGMLCKEERLRTMVREELVSEHGFSVDGFKASTVEAIRINAKLPRILEAIERLMRIREEEHKTGPAIRIRYALMRQNVEELPDAVRRWGELGVETLECGYLSLANGIPREECMFYHQELLEQVFEEARTVAAAYPKLQLVLPPLIRDEEPKKANPVNCRAPWSFVMIDTNGEILPCYRAFEAMRFGNLYAPDAKPFAEEWNSEKYQALRSTVNRDDREKYFSYCGSCETRYGWAREESHLGDLTWMNVVSARLKAPVDHQRPHRELVRKRPDVVSAPNAPVVRGAVSQATPQAE